MCAEGELRWGRESGQVGVQHHPSVGVWRIGAREIPVEPRTARVALVVHAQGIDEPTGARSGIVGRGEAKAELVPRFRRPEVPVQGQLMHGPPRALVAHPRRVEGGGVRSRARRKAAGDLIGITARRGQGGPGGGRFAAPFHPAHVVGSEVGRGVELHRHVANDAGAVHLRADKTARHLGVERRVWSAQQKRAMTEVGARGQRRVQCGGGEVDRGPSAICTPDRQPAVRGEHRILEILDVVVRRG